MNDLPRQRQLKHIRDCIAECDKKHSQEEILEAEKHLDPWRTTVKKRLITSYCNGNTPAIVVKVLFRTLKLKAA